MPSGKVAPLPKVASGAGGLKAVPPAPQGGGGAKAPPAPQAGGVKAKAARSYLLDTPQRFVRATRDNISLASRSRGQGTLSAILFVSGVGLGLFAFGIFLVVVGEENYIVDVMTFGGICLFMGVVAIVMGAVFVWRPIYQQTKRLAAMRAAAEEEEAGDQRLQAQAGWPGGIPPPASYQDIHLRPEILVDDGRSPREGSSTAPQDNDLYKRKEGGQKRSSVSEGRMTVTPPPLLTQPLKDRPGTTSTELTTSDYREMMEEEELDVYEEKEDEFGLTNKEDSPVVKFTLENVDAVGNDDAVGNNDAVGNDAAVERDSSQDGVQVGEGFLTAEQAGEWNAKSAEPDTTENVPAASEGEQVSIRDVSPKGFGDNASQKTQDASRGDATSPGLNPASQDDESGLRQMLMKLSEDEEKPTEEPRAPGRDLLMAERSKTWERDTDPQGDFVVALKVEGNIR